MDIDCRSCGKLKIKYRDCPGKFWYTVGDIRWCDKQVIWLIENFLDLTSDGIILKTLDWPNDPDDFSQIDLPSVQRPKKASAYFTKPAEVIAELEVRLKRLGRSGELLLAELRAGMEGNLTDEAKAAFYYITGVRRKRQSYPQWKADRQRKTHKNMAKPRLP